MTTAIPQHAAARPDTASPPRDSDDLLTVAGIACLAFLITDTLQQGLGHALPALLTISPFGMLTAAGWSSAYDNSSIDALGCLVNLSAGLIALLALVAWKRGAPRGRLLLLLVSAFSLFAGSGYLVFAGLTNFGDWYSLVQGFAAPNLLRGLLLVAGALVWIATLFVAGSLLRRQFGALRSDRGRAVRVAFSSWLAAVVLAAIAGAVNRMGLRFVVFSDYPATVLALVGVLLVPLRIHGQPGRGAGPAEAIRRSWAWIAVSVVLSIAFVVVLGRGILLHGNVQ
jgi:hypothetical protein